MDRCRAKVTLSGIKENYYQGQKQESVTVELTAQYSNNPEDNNYSKATPSAAFTLYVSNPDAIEFFKSKSAVGQFYVDFIPIQPPPTE